MNLEQTNPSRRTPPLRPLALGVAMTLALLGLGATLTWGLYQRGQRLITRDLRLRTLLGEILRLDEVLTMSARMAAATGDLAWEARYHKHEPLIEAHIVEAMQLAPPAVVTAIESTEKANLALVDLEQRAFALVRAGRQPEAAALLDSRHYDLNKDIYYEGVERTKRVIAQEADEAYDEQQREVRGILWLALGALVVLGFAWRSIIRRLLDYRSARAAQVALAAANRDLDARVTARTAELSEANAMLEHSLERHAATQRELMTASRKAGMAVVATGVLHNVGNVLNSVVTSCATVTDVIRTERLEGLTMASELLRSGDVDKVRRVPEYLDKVTAHLLEKQALVLREMDSLAKNIEHIELVVAKQQGNIGGLPMLELFDVAEVVEDALRFESGSDTREGITVTCELGELPIVLADRHKVTQALVSLIANARHALRHHDDGPRRLIVRSRAAGGERFALEVEDTGYGIAPENLGRVFEHGFTTKKDGHGFGLHASAVDVQAMGGTLRAHSDGPGRGARFTIELPLAPRDELHSRRAAVARMRSTSVA